MRAVTKSCGMTVADFTPIQVKVDAREDSTLGQNDEGEVSQDDGVRCVRLDPITIPPKRNFAKFMSKGRAGREGVVLRYLAKLDSKKTVEQERRFIVSCFLTDESIAVYEPPIRNSGKFRI